MKFSSLMPLEAVLPHLDVRDKKTALKLLAAHAAPLAQLPEKEIYATLLAREQIGATGMGNGVCIPHGRFEDLKKPLAVFARLTRAIEFGAADGKPVDLVVLLLTPASLAANTDHLKMMAIISRLLRDKDLCDSLRAAKDAKAIHARLAAERPEEVK